MDEVSAIDTRELPYLFQTKTDLRHCTKLDLHVSLVHHIGENVCLNIVHCKRKE